MQTEHRQFLGAHGEEDVPVQDQRHGDVARTFLGIEQEVRVQVNFAVVFDVETGAGFQVGQAAGVRQIDIEKAPDPGADFRRRRHQIDPDRFQAAQIIRRVDVDLGKTAIAQFKRPYRGFFVAQVGITDQLFAHLVGDDFENCLAALFADFVPYRQTIC